MPDNLVLKRDLDVLEYTTVEYFCYYADAFESIVANNSVEVDELLNYLLVTVFGFNELYVNIKAAIEIIQNAYKRYTNGEEYIKIRASKLNPETMIIEIETTFPIVDFHNVESNLFQKRGLAKAANTSGPYKESIF